MALRRNKKLSYYKRKAWEAFSQYIRTRDCWKTTKTLNNCKCITCSHIVSFDHIQAGHAIGGRNNSILFDEELVNGQCDVCNGYKNGRYAEYSLWFIENYGLEKWEEKVLLSKQIKQYRESDYIRIYEEYTDKLNELLQDIDLIIG